MFCRFSTKINISHFLIIIIALGVRHFSAIEIKLFRRWKVIKLKRIFLEVAKVENEYLEPKNKNSKPNKIK